MLEERQGDDVSMHHHRMECECEGCFKSWSAAQDGPNKIGAFSVALKRIATLEAELRQARHLLDDHGPECRNVTNAQFVELRDQLASAMQELKNIAYADPSKEPNKWEEDFRAWAQSRARHTLDKLEAEKKGGS